MNSTPRRFLALLPVAVLTLTLTLLFSGGASVRAMLQVSPISTPTPPLPVLASPGVIEPPTIQPPPSMEAPTSVPLPATVGPTPTVRGFLPAPTIVNPNDLKSLPLAQPPASGGSALSEPTALPPSPAAVDPTTRAAVALINYLWLLCGGALLIGGAVAIFLIWRRGRQT